MFENISNMNQFMNNKKMGALWNLKKGGILLPPSPQITASSNKEQTLSSIANKLSSGKRLSPEEMRYLREFAPEMYRQAVEADAERSAYESAAKSCRTKEDVQNLHAKSMAGIMATAKADPVGAQIKVAAVTDSHLSFIQSSTYNKLPTQTELNQKQAKGENDSNHKREKPNTAKETDHLMQKITDAEQNIQFTLRNYHAQAEKRVNAEASSKNEPITIETEEEAAAFSKIQNSVESTKAYLQSKGIIIENSMENHVSFSSLMNNVSSQSVTKEVSPAPSGSAFVGRAHAAYAVAQSTVASAPEPISMPGKTKSGLRAKA